MTRFHLISVVYAMLMAGLMLALTAGALPALAEGSSRATANEKALQSGPVQLVGALEVRDDFIHLNDVFSPAGKYAERVIARAPEPGETLVLEARWLWKIARGHGLKWRPTSNFDQVNVTRPSRTITTDVLRRMIRDALFQRTGEDDLVAIDLDNETAQLKLSDETMGEPRLRQFTIDPSSGRFTAVFAGPTGPDAKRTLTLGGRAVQQIEVAVPIRRVSPGHIIRADDLEIARFSAVRVSRTALVHEIDLIGQEAARTLTAGQPISASNVRAPELVRRNASVTITLTTSNMRLTATGRALESGAEGEVVRVQNLQSRITIDAIVTGENRVRAAVPDRLAAHGGLQ
jgi:flagella basal body P-ring formation protein FlgA